MTSNAHVRKIVSGLHRNPRPPPTRELNNQSQIYGTVNCALEAHRPAASWVNCYDKLRCLGPRLSAPSIFRRTAQPSTEDLPGLRFRD